MLTPGVTAMTRHVTAVTRPPAAIRHGAAWRRRDDRRPRGDAMAET
jgi:hypothetical protein